MGACGFMLSLASVLSKRLQILPSAFKTMLEGFSSIRSGITVAYPDAEFTIEQARLAEDVSNLRVGAFA